MINNIALFFGISAPRTLLATKSEKFKYRPGRMDFRLWLNPNQQMDFERELTVIRAAREKSMTAQEGIFAKQLADIERDHRGHVATIEREYDKAMRALIAKYGAISPEEPIQLSRATFSKALGAAAEA
jgi:hypothetical protein